MKWWKLLRRKRREQELDDEIQHHLAVEIEERIRDGASPEEANRAARRDFGNQLLIKDVTRDTWGWTTLATVLQDMRFGLRMLRRTPVLTAVVVLSLALGIGANTAIFSLLDAVVLKMLPVKDPQGLVFLIHGMPGGLTPVFSYPAFQQMRDLNRVFDGVLGRFGVARYEAVFKGSGADRAEEVETEAVSGNYFSVLGISPILGRAFGPADDSPQAVSGAVISYGYWRRRFARDPAAIGTTFTLRGAPVSIVGIAPPEFFGETVGQRPDVWIPLATLDLADPGGGMLTDQRWAWVRLMARLKPGIPVAQARAGIEVLYQQIKQFPNDGHVELMRGSQGYAELREQFSERLWILMTVTGLVLLIACANVASLLLARASARRKEITVRLSLGASRGRIIRQLLTESVVLASLSGALGVLFSQWAATGLLVMASDGPAPIPIDIAPDLRVFAFTAGVSLLSGTLLGIAPALRATKMDLGPALKGTPALAGSARLGLGKALVISQVALSVPLLIVAGMFVHTLENLKDVSASFGWERVVQAQLSPLPRQYSQADATSVYQRLLERARGLPGVRSASLSLTSFHTGSGSVCCLAIPGYIPGSNDDLTVAQNLVTTVLRNDGDSCVARPRLSAIGSSAPPVGSSDQSGCRHKIFRESGSYRQAGQTQGAERGIPP
jgi:predicted permease